MMTKEQEDYIFKLKAELMFRGKDEDEVHAIGDELQDHFEMAEANGDDVSNILNTPVKDYADNFSKEMSFTKGLPKYLTYSYSLCLRYSQFQISLKMTLP